MTNPAEPMAAVAPIPTNDPSVYKAPAETLPRDKGSLASFAFVTAFVWMVGLGYVPARSPPAVPDGGSELGALMIPFQGAREAYEALGAAVSGWRGVRPVPFTTTLSQAALPVEAAGPK